MFARTPMRSIPTSLQITDGDINLSMAVSAGLFSCSSQARLFKKSPSAVDLKQLGRHLANQQHENKVARLPATISRNNGYQTSDHQTVEHSIPRRGRHKNLTAAVSAIESSETGVDATEERAGVCWMESRRVVVAAPGVTREMYDAEF